MATQQDQLALELDKDLINLQTTDRQLLNLTFNFDHLQKMIDKFNQLLTTQNSSIDKITAQLATKID